MPRLVRRRAALREAEARIARMESEQESRAVLTNILEMVSLLADAQTDALLAIAASRVSDENLLKNSLQTAALKMKDLLSLLRNELNQEAVRSIAQKEELKGLREALLG